jgi:hypothetical protein
MPADGARRHVVIATPDNAEFALRLPLRTARQRVQRAPGGCRPWRAEAP